MTRGEGLGVGASAAAHLALLALLSLGLVAAPKPKPVETAPMTVELLGDPAAEAQAPVTSTSDPLAAQSPEPAPLPDPAPAEPQPQPQPLPSPPAATVAPSPLPKPVPATRPAPTRPATPAASKPASKSAPATPAPPRRAGLPGNFTDGIPVERSGGTASAPRVQIGSAQLAGLAAAIRRQVQPCADRIVSPGPGAEDIVTKLNLRLNRDGSLASAPSVVSQSTNADNARYASRVGEVARAAFRQCAPFNLPAELYDGWKNINLNYRLPS